MMEESHRPEDNTNMPPSPSTEHDEDDNVKEAAWKFSCRAFTTAEIADMLGVSKSTVDRWLKERRTAMKERLRSESDVLILDRYQRIAGIESEVWRRLLRLSVGNDKSTAAALLSVLRANNRDRAELEADLKRQAEGEEDEKKPIHITLKIDGPEIKDPRNFEARPANTPDRQDEVHNQPSGEEEPKTVQTRDPGVMPVEDDPEMEAYCARCQAPRHIVNARQIDNGDGWPEIRGVCPECSSSLTKNVKVGLSLVEWDEQHRLGQDTPG
jgi:DNA-binding transcriptional MerR regulator